MNYWKHCPGKHKGFLNNFTVNNADILGENIEMYKQLTLLRVMFTLGSTYKTTFF